jgi:deoxycytidine triphosphate deaminase
MARILADRDIHKLIGSVLLDADERFINPNGIELRLGRHVLFHSTSEELELSSGQFLKVNPGESVAISSIETIDFRAEAVAPVLPGKMLMGLITPTTTMMREGIAQVATKIDAGFRGLLNWGLRNGSTQPLIVEFGEPMFKLTLFELAEDEAPDIPYGVRPDDSYQDTEGIRRSSRRLPADIPKHRIVASSFDRLDPKKQLREAGYPFDHIGTELTTLHGKFETVSSDVRMMRDEFSRQTAELATKIQSETGTLATKLEDERKNILERVEALFDRKFIRIAGIIVGAIPVMYGGITFLQGAGLRGGLVSFIALFGGILVILLSYVLTKRER